MLRLALRTVRFRAGTFVAAFLAMFFAAAVLMACGGLIETGIRTAVPPQQLAYADVVVAGQQEYDATGGDPDEPAILPERVRVEADLADALAALPGVERTETHVFDGRPAAGAVDAIGVVAEPGADLDRLERAVDAVLGDGATALVGDERGRAELLEATGSGVNVVALAGVFTAFAILVSVFGVTSMLALAITQRRQELALLRAIGATPRQVRRLVLRETFLLAVLATAVAAFPGRFLGERLFDVLAEQGIATEGMAFHQGWIPTVAAMGVAVLAALAGAWGAGRRAARVRPTQALTEVALDGRSVGVVRLLLGVVALGAGVALTILTSAVVSGPLTPATGAPAVIVLAVACALLAPVLATVAVAVLRVPVQALGGVTGHLAVLNARGRGTRTAAAMGPVILLTGVATGMLYLQTTNDEADRRAYADNLVADVVVTSEAGVTDDLVAQVAALPGVAGASAYVASTGFVETPEDRSPAGEGWSLQGVTPEGAAATTPVRTTTGALDDLVGDTVALEEGHAGRLGLGVGDDLTLRLGDGRSLDAEVVALFAAPDDFDTILLPVGTLAAHTTDGAATQVLVRGDGSASDLGADLEAALGGASGVGVSDREVLLREFDEQTRTATFAIYVMVLMIAGYAAITVANTLASSTATRRRELGLQRLAGATRGQVVRMVATEGAMVAVGGIALGTLAAGAVLVPVGLKRLDSPLPAGSPLLYAAVVVGTALLALAATLAPAWRVTRGRPAEAALAVE